MQTRCFRQNGKEIVFPSESTKEQVFKVYSIDAIIPNHGSDGYILQLYDGLSAFWLVYLGLQVNRGFGHPREARLRDHVL